MRHRRRARARALTGGYFWLPCPICGQKFGGHEWRRYGGHESSIPIAGDPSKREGICPDCTRRSVGDELTRRYESRSEYQAYMGAVMDALSGGATGETEGET